jgi:hypothetical protein
VTQAAPPGAPTAQGLEVLRWWARLGDPSALLAALAGDKSLVVLLVLRHGVLEASQVAGVDARMAMERTS